MVILSLMILIITIALTPLSSISQIESNDKHDNDYHYNGGITSILIARLTSIVFLFSGALAYNALYIQSIGSGLSIYSGLFQITVLSQSFDVFIFILAALILLPWSNKLTAPINDLGENILKIKMTGPVVREYSLIVLFSALGSSLLLSSGNLLSLYLAIELQSFGVYILATIYRNSESATSAGLKYFLLGGLSSCLILLGCVLIYSYTGVIYFEDIYSLLTSSSQSNDSINIVVQLGFILILIGFLFKIAGAPFHNWAPDVYNDVPTIVTTWLTIMPKIAIVILLFEMISTINLDVLSNINILHNVIGSENPLNLNLIKNLLLISSFLSLTIGTIVGLAQIKIKRLLAYSTISHVGFILLALAINTEESLESLLFYIIQYSLTNLNTFFILLAFGYILKKKMSQDILPGVRDTSLTEVENIFPAYSSSKPKLPLYQNNDINLIKELKGQFWNNPILSLSLAVCLFSMAGIPPLIGFFAKAEVLYSATHNGYYFMSIIAILVSVISAYYYLQIIKVMHFESELTTTIQSAHIEDIESKINENLIITNTHSFIISILTFSLLFFILKPSIILNSIHLLALNIFYT